FDNQVNFEANDGTTGFELWKVQADGTVLRAADIRPGPGSSNPSGLTAFGSLPPADFNADGNSDLLWRHTGGTTVVWEMSGATKVGDVNLSAISTDWTIQDTGDFNGDGRSGDILWRHAGDGQMVLWEMVGSAKIADV